MHTIQLTEDQSAALKQFIERCKITSELELINWAFTILQWTVAEREKGNEIASVNTVSKRYEILRIPMLDGLSPAGICHPAPKFTVIDGGKGD